MNTGKNVQQLVAASAAATGPLPVAGLSYQLGPNLSALVVVQSSAALATFVVEGRVSPEAPWAQLHAPDASLAGGAGTKALAIASGMAEMRLNWTGNAGTVTAWLQA